MKYVSEIFNVHQAITPSRIGQSYFQIQLGSIVQSYPFAKNRYYFLYMQQCNLTILICSGQGKQNNLSIISHSGD